MDSEFFRINSDLDLQQTIHQKCNSQCNTDCLYNIIWFQYYHNSKCDHHDSKGEITGIVGVDFTAEWYDSCMKSGRVVSAILLMAALSIGIVLAFLLLSDNRKRFTVLFRDLEKLNQEMGRLDDIIMESSIKKLDMLPDHQNAVLKELADGEEAKRTTQNEFEELDATIGSLYQKLHKYLNYVYSEVQVDDTTGALNKVAYKAKI